MRKRSSHPSRHPHGHWLCSASDITPTPHLSQHSSQLLPHTSLLWPNLASPSPWGLLAACGEALQPLEHEGPAQDE